MRVFILTLVAAAAAVVVVNGQITSSAANAAEQQPAPVSLRELSSSLERLSSRIRPSVVQIFTTGYKTSEDTESGSTSLLTRQRSIGSGVILSADGFIATNAHVVRGARRVQVRLPVTAQELAGKHSIVKPEGRLIEARVVGSDRETDLAILKINVPDLPFLSLGDSDTLRQGQLVMAFGNPLGLEASVSLGVVSSTSRQVHADASMIYIQTDAPINPGNSGGPLIDADGRIVGINTFILSQSGGSEGIGFAIPSNIVKNVFLQIRKQGGVRRGEIGIYAQSITPTLAAALHLPQEWGVLAGDVAPGGAAEAAGLQVRDIILSLNGKPMENARQFEVNLYRYSSNDKVTLDVLRGDEHLKVSVPVSVRQDDPDRFADMVNPEDNLIPKLNILAIGLDKRLISMLPDLRHSYGVVVAAGSTEDLSSGTGLRPGDVIYSVNGTPVSDAQSLKSALDRFKPGDAIALQVERDGVLRFVVVELE